MGLCEAVPSKQCLRRYLFLLLCCASILSTGVYANTTFKRVISLDACMDWMLVSYADASRVLALSPLYPRYPFPINDQDWPLHDGSLESIFRLNPDLILVGEYNARLLRSQLQRLDLPVQVVKLPQSLSELKRYENRIRQLLAVEPVMDEPLPELSAIANEAVDTRHSDQSPPRLLLLGPNGIGTGRDTFEDQLLSQAGWQNYLESQGYRALDLEMLIADPPDAILTTDQDSAAMANLFAQHPALSAYKIDKAGSLIDDWRWQCPGPWTWELVDQLAALREPFD